MDNKDGGTTASEARLIDQARHGRLDAYNQLVLAYQALAYNVAYRLLGDHDAASDAVQDSFLKAFRRIDQFRGDEAYFRAWLLRIVVNTCYDALRKRRRQWARTLPIEEEAGEYEWRAGLRDRSEMPEEYVLRRELAERIQHAIEGLPLDQRTVLVLSDIEGLQYQEIADIAGVPIGTVKSRLARARGRVRDTLVAERHDRTTGKTPEGPPRRPALGGL